MYLGVCIYAYYIHALQGTTWSLHMYLHFFNSILWVPTVERLRASGMLGTRDTKDPNFYPLGLPAAEADSICCSLFGVRRQVRYCIVGEIKHHKNSHWGSHKRVTRDTTRVHKYLGLPQRKTCAVREFGGGNSDKASEVGLGQVTWRNLE